MPHGSVRSGLVLVASAAFLAACDTESLTSPATAEPTASRVAATTTSTTTAAPALPKATVSTTPTVQTGKTITVKSGGNLQTAINSAVPGDVIVLQAGATFTGNFTLPKKSGTGWVTIRTSATDAQLGAPGTRVSPAKASLMPKIVSPNGSPAIRTYAGAHHYRLVGLEVTSTASVSTVLLRLGSGSSTAQSTLSSVPHDIVVDRSYIHGRSSLHLKNCVELHSARSAIVDSYVSQCHSQKVESHAIIGWNGPGPFLIENNYIEGAGINIMFGGSDPANQAMIPSDITIRRNHVTKPLAWKGKWTTKNLLELKIGRRILAEGNVFENSWVDGQVGFAFVFKTAVGSRASSWGITEDVTLRHNLIRNVAGGVNMSANSGGRGLPSRRYRFEHNVWDRVGSSNGTSYGRMFQVLTNVKDVQIEHNTAIHAPVSGAALVTFSGGSNGGFVFRDNVVMRGTYGVKGDGVGEGKSALDAKAPGHVFKHNAVVGARSTIYPTGNSFPSSLTAVQFASLSGRDYRLSSSSPYKGKASDGTDPGANVTALNAAIAGVVR